MQDLRLRLLIQIFSPAGFNNLCEHGIENSATHFRDALLKRVSNCKNILIIAEEHTRNTWYLENIRILQEIISSAGFNVKVATFLTIQPSFCENAKFIELETATGNSVRIHCFKKILSEFGSDETNIDLIIMNNDLTSGIPDVLKESKVPIYPSIQAGWHSRLKSHHFCHTQELIDEFCRIIDVDPWLFSCKFSIVDEVNINEEKDRNILIDSIAKLLEEIQSKYDEHNINEKPYVVF